MNGAKFSIVPAYLVSTSGFDVDMATYKEVFINVAYNRGMGTIPTVVHRFSTRVSNDTLSHNEICTRDT